MSTKRKLFGILSVAATAAALTAAAAYADDHGDKKEKMEKCAIVEPDGSTGLITRDCANPPQHTCAGAASGDGKANWILLPEGVCAKIKGGEVVGHKE